MKCPRCNVTLKGYRLDAGFIHVCSYCDGRAVAMPVIRKFIPEPILKDLWQKTIAETATSEISCPSCTHKMSNVTLYLEGRVEYFDVCENCHFIWFDPNEFERLPKNAAKTSRPKDLPAEAKKILAQATIDSLQRQREFEEIGISSPDHWWEIILGFFGMPVEYNDTEIKPPVVTYLVGFAMILATGLSYSNLETTIQGWGLIPNQLTRHFGMTFISSFLLHGGATHLIGNLYFLLVFGDNVEDKLGPKSFLLLLLLAALVGDLVHILIDPRSTMPVVGASGGISGLLVYYCLSFPRAKVGLLFWFRWIRIPVGLMIFFWIVGQIIGAFQQIDGFSDVSALSHLGGALIGVVFWLFTRKPSTSDNAWPGHGQIQAQNMSGREFKG